MPHGQLHKTKRNRNFMILAAIIGWVALIWVITVLKMT